MLRYIHEFDRLQHYFAAQDPTSTASHEETPRPAVPGFQGPKSLSVASSLAYNEPSSRASNYTVASPRSRAPSSLLGGDGYHDAESVLSRPPPGLSASLWSFSQGRSGPNTISTNKLQQRQVYRLEDGQADPATVRIDEEGQPPEPTYPCPFNFLHCTEAFSNCEQWMTHSLSHFRGMSPPKRVVCPLENCQNLDEVFQTGEEAWTRFMGHMALHHQRGEGLQHSTKEKSQHLFQYLHNLRVIGDADLQELRRTGRLSQEPKLYRHRESKRDVGRQRKKPRGSIGGQQINERSVEM